MEIGRGGAADPHIAVGEPLVQEARGGIQRLAGHEVSGSLPLAESPDARIAVVRTIFAPGANVSVGRVASEIGVSVEQVHADAATLVTRSARQHAKETGAATPQDTMAAEFAWLEGQRAQFAEVHDRLVDDSRFLEEQAALRIQAGLGHSAATLRSEQQGIIVHAQRVAENPVYLAVQNASARLRQQLDSDSPQE